MRLLILAIAFGLLLVIAANSKPDSRHSIRHDCVRDDKVQRGTRLELDAKIFKMADEAIRDRRGAPASVFQRFGYFGKLQRGAGYGAHLARPARAENSHQPTRRRECKMRSGKPRATP
jgi:hypothetical protein